MSKRAAQRFARYFSGSTRRVLEGRYPRSHVSEMVHFSAIIAQIVKVTAKIATHAVIVGCPTFVFTLQ
jgi:hypothetical protein